RNLETRLLTGARSRVIAPALLSALLSAHPARLDSQTAPVEETGLLLGEYVVDFFPKWAEGKVVLRGSSARPKARKTIDIVQDGLHRIVFETKWKRDEHGWRIRDTHGQLVDLGWGDAAAAWIPLREFDIEHVLALAEKVDSAGIGKEIWRKVRSFLKQMVDYAQLKKDFPRERANPVTLVAPPAGVPVPPTPEFAACSADLVEALAYGGFRPGEILAACGRHYAPEDLGPKYLRICQRNVDGVIVAGTKSSRYPEKDVFLLGPLPKTIARRVAKAGSDGLLFPYPGTSRLWNESEYRNWREDYF